MSRVGSLAPERPGPDRADGLAFLRGALRERAAHGGAEHTLVLLPGPMVPPAGLGAGSRPPSVVFDTPHAGRVRGWDVALELARRDHDLATVAWAARRAHERTRQLAHPGLAGGARRGFVWVGGHSFVAGACRDRTWASFPDAYFFVPRWTQHTLDGTSVLALALGAGDRRADVEGILAEYASLMDAAAAPGWRPGALGERPSADRTRWIADVRRALAAIEDGTLRKVVLARHLDLVAEDDGAPDVRSVLGELERRFPSCTRFLLARDGAEFLGATPETLVRRQGREVVAEAMAGSCRRGDEAALLASGKDAREHALVVEEIAARLRPHCDALDRPDTPEVERLANVSHLCTRIDARLRDATHVLRLVADLHPTPAVSGTPNAAAVDWLTRAEPVPRGWYASPFGWFDVAGDGHFVVALRSCVRHAGRLRLYAGAGIVRGSEPEREFDETVLKMRAMLDGLHVGADEPAERVG